MFCSILTSGVAQDSNLPLRDEADASKGVAMKTNVKFELNGKTHSLTIDPSRRLLWVLRSDLGLTGSKYGCGKGLCGACTVLLDKKAVRSCLIPLSAVAGKKVMTIEGLSQDGALHPIQSAFVKYDALQCGICTPGMIMNAYALLLRSSTPSRQEIVRGMEGNLCRCGAYKRIVQAVQAAGKVIKGGVE